MFLLSCIGSAIYFSIYVYLITFMTNYVPHLSMRDALTLNFVSFASLFVFIPCLAKLADRIGCKVIIYCGLMLLLLVEPVLHLLFVNNFVVNIFAVLILSFTAACYNVPVLTLTISQVPKQHKFAGTAFGFNLGAAVLGGTTPLLITMLMHWLSPITSLSFYLVAVAVVGFVVVFSTKEPHKMVAGQSHEISI